MSDTPDPILSVAPLGFIWQTLDPFLFCVHHDDAYPAGEDDMGPPPDALRGRRMGQDFVVKDGWRMYHGSRVPGFPRHPHRGFETITLARRGYIDHTDSLGASARFGEGDVQWMTAGKGIVHSEMFPLVNRDAPNPTEMFQIWINLPAEDKLAAPYFTMMWSDTIPRETLVDDAGGRTEITVIAGGYGELRAPQPPPNSWAARPDSEVAIWALKLSPGARWSAPAASAGVNRVIYYFAGERATIGGRDIESGYAVQVRPDTAIEIVNGAEAGEILVLQGRPIGESVVQHGPFVMNTAEEIRETMMDYQRTGFGGWQWPADGPAHPRDAGRFAKHGDGSEERPGT